MFVCKFLFWRKHFRIHQVSNTEVEWRRAFHEVSSISPASSVSLSLFELKGQQFSSIWNNVQTSKNFLNDFKSFGVRFPIYVFCQSLRLVVKNLSSNLLCKPLLQNFRKERLNLHEGCIDVLNALLMHISRSSKK